MDNFGYKVVVKFGPNDVSVMDSVRRSNFRGGEHKSQFGVSRTNEFRIRKAFNILLPHVELQKKTFF